MEKIVKVKSIFGKNSLQRFSKVNFSKENLKKINYFIYLQFSKSESERDIIADRMVVDQIIVLSVESLPKSFIIKRFNW